MMRSAILDAGGDSCARAADLARSDPAMRCPARPCGGALGRRTGVQRRPGGTRAIVVAVVLVVALLGGCYSPYLTPYEPATLHPFLSTGGIGSGAEGMSGADTTSQNAIAAALAVRPEARFPANLALARIQGVVRQSSETSAPAYVVESASSGEETIDVDRMRNLPGVSGFAMINSLLVGANEVTPEDLRKAAARIHADMLLLYTFSMDSTIRDVLPPLSFVTLGIAPTQSQDVVLTASAVLIDVRSGFVYGTLQVMEDGSTLSNAWNTWEAKKRRGAKLEKAALDKMLDEFALMWPEIVRTYSVQKSDPAGHPATLP